MRSGWWRMKPIPRTNHFHSRSPTMYRTLAFHTTLMNFKEAKGIPWPDENAAFKIEMKKVPDMNG